MSTVLASNPIGGIVDWFREGVPEDRRGLSFDLGLKAGGAGGVAVGVMTGVGTVGYRLARETATIKPTTAALRAGMVGGIVLGELGALSTVRLPKDKAAATVVGGGLGVAAVGGGAAAVMSAANPELLRSPRKLASHALVAATFGLAAGSLAGITGFRT